MSFVFAARSAALCKWAADVGLGKQVIKLGVAADKEEAKAVVQTGWAGESDWKILASREAETTQDEVIARVAARDKQIDPNLYPRIKGTVGIFRVTELAVLNAMLLNAAMASADAPLVATKPKAKDYGEYLLRRAAD